ncbi:hypothetical protein IU500_34375 [Nocardia terpenica]|uniref:hypothetical protein n=1 Tax=Nocardia terpenica TaxID=455432 RepID=UPI001894B889|nr:hypothetical protein [Nocardia terpenica]MBF6065421.1 hypothetical protein [Nocardia terpenica]MBF6109103.1 hypothetical protein [Nocardia terpenica]MBF6114695.1 hypothetical protein [Nocardia terpenica]MBF6123380.1 hypothetical protein [Nocardia terpenica]MBF6156602.1 hypothetical protein [Nocardia terpenica]
MTTEPIDTTADQAHPIRRHLMVIGHTGAGKTLRMWQLAARSSAVECGDVQRPGVAG